MSITLKPVTPDFLSEMFGCTLGIVPHRQSRDHVPAHGGGEQALTREHHEGHQHEHDRQLRHAQHRLGFLGSYELRQDGEQAM